MFIYKSEAGLTLIELLIAMAILPLIALAILPLSNLPWISRNIITDWVNQQTDNQIISTTLGNELRSLPTGSLQQPPGGGNLLVLQRQAPNVIISTNNEGNLTRRQAGNEEIISEQAQFENLEQMATVEKELAHPNHNFDVHVIRAEKNFPEIETEGDAVEYPTTFWEFFPRRGLEE